MRVMEYVYKIIEVVNISKNLNKYLVYSVSFILGLSLAWFNLTPLGKNIERILSEHIELAQFINPMDYIVRHLLFLFMPALAIQALFSLGYEKLPYHHKALDDFYLVAKVFFKLPSTLLFTLWFLFLGFSVYAYSIDPGHALGILMVSALLFFFSGLIFKWFFKFDAEKFKVNGNTRIKPSHIYVSLLFTVVLCYFVTSGVNKYEDIKLIVNLLGI